MAHDTDILAAGTTILQQEGVYLDERRWDDWLALYCEDCEYWMPTWKDEEVLASDPQTEISHIYYSSRAGLADRVLRIRSSKSPASSPLPRTVHLVNAVIPQGPPESEKIRLRSSWVTHVYFPRATRSHAFFGRSEHELVLREGRWQIRRKKVILLNDYIPGMLDVYCV